MTLGQPRTLLRGTTEPTGSYSTSAAASTVLLEGETTTIAVTFTPVSAGSHAGRLLIPNNDPEAPEVRVDLEGVGIAPRIQVDPRTVDFDERAIGCKQTQALTVRNEGNADLTITDVSILAATDEAQVDIDVITNGSLPFVLAPYDAVQNGPELEFYLDYQPWDEVLDEPIVQISSDDPQQPELQVTATGNGRRIEVVSERWIQPPELRTDVLVVWDRGMSETLTSRALPNAERVVNDIMTTSGDVHLAAVVAEDGCVLGGTPVLDSTAPPPVPWIPFETMLDLDEELDTPTWTEWRGLDLMRAALSAENTGIGGCNADFYRPEADLAVIFVTDRADSSVSTWTAYVSALEALEEDGGSARVHAVAGQDPPTCAEATPGSGMYESTVATGGIFTSICGTDWSRDLAAVPEDMTRDLSFHVLEQAPVRQTIRVFVDGVPLLTGWAYDVTGNTIVFERESIPATGAQVEVTYDLLPRDCGPR